MDFLSISHVLNVQIMKPISILFGIFMAAILSSCNSGGSKSDKDSTAATEQVPRSDTTAASKDSMNKKTDTVATAAALSQESLAFLSKVAASSQMEVKLGELAQQNAKNQRVKDYGAMMVRDHGQARTQVKNMAAGSNLVISDSLSAKDKKEYLTLEMKKGSPFDKAYMEMMVKGHNEAVRDFQKAEKLPDAGVKSFIDKTLPVIMAHLDSARSLSKLK